MVRFLSEYFLAYRLKNSKEKPVQLDLLILHALGQINACDHWHKLSKEQWIFFLSLRNIFEAKGGDYK